MYKIKVNEHFSFDMENTSKGLMVNGAPLVIDAVLNHNHGNIIYNNKSFNVELISVNEDKKVLIKVNGVEYSVVLQDRFDQLLQKMGMDHLNKGKIKEVKAPMPGLVLNIFVAEGQEVKKGDNLLVLEAMKMENILKSPTDGIIQKIGTKIGDKLEKNTVLVTFR